MTSTCIVTSEPAISRLVTLARTLGGPVVAVVAGTQPVADAVARSGVDRVLWLGEPGESPVAAFATAAADTVAAVDVPVVLAADRAADRVLAGAVAARMSAPVVAGVSDVEPDPAGVRLTRAVLGGVAEEQLLATGPVVVVTDGGDTVTDAPAVDVGSVDATPAALRIVETRPAAVTGADLGAARRVVSVGRGLREQGDVALIESLADALGAATACTRPLAEGVGFFPKDRYVGVSGRTVTPDLYLALGISGQVQHMVGARGAGTVVAVNSDPDAPIFREADYVVVGDLYQVVPALTEALR